MKKQSPTFEAEGTQPDYVRDLLDAGRDDALRGYDVDAGLARHMAAVQAGAPLSPWAEELVAASGKTAAVAAAGAAAAKLATGKVVAGVALAVLTAGAIAAIVLSAPEQTAGVAPSRAPTVPAAPVAPPFAPPSPDEQGSAARQAAPQGQGGEAIELEIAPITTRSKREAHGGAERASELEPKASSARAGSAKSLEALIDGVGKQQSVVSPKGRVDLVPATNAAARTEAGAAAASSERVASAPTPAPAPVVDDSRLEREMGMLAVAQRVLKSDPERALRLSRQGEQEFAGSMFMQERQQVLLLALIELGRSDEAKRLALPYLKRWPNGPFSDRLRTALAAAKPEN